jgi:hypothetical protein
MLLKISYIILASNNKDNLSDGNYTKILLDENNKIPSISIDNFMGMDAHIFLKKITETYLKYDYEFIIKQLGDTIISDNVVEVIYISTVPYAYGFNSNGNVYGIKDLHKNNINIEEKYAETIARFGSAPFR